MTPKVLDNMRWVAHRDPEAVTPDWLVERLDALEAELDERWMLLPMGEDGEAIHVGDRMRYADGDPRGEFDVNGIGDGGTLFSVDEDSCTAWWTTALGKRHVMPRTLEYVLEEYGAAFEAETDDIAPLVERYADEIRELMGVER